MCWPDDEKKFIMTSTNTAHIRHRAHDDHGGPHGDGESNQPVRQGGQPKQGPGQNHRKRKERRQLAKQAEERADHEDGGHQPPDGQEGGHLGFLHFEYD